MRPTNITVNWLTYHKKAGNNKRFFLSSTSAGNTYGSAVWSSDNTTLGVNGNIIAGGGTAVDLLVYAWAPVEGYSSFGQYTGNNNADGPVVYTGMRPRFILIKRVSAAENWMLIDTERNTFNVAGTHLMPNNNLAEGTSTPVDHLSNGFKIRTTSTAMNGGNDTYVYAAFAEHPFKTARAR